MIETNLAGAASAPPAVPEVASPGTVRVLGTASSPVIGRLSTTLLMLGRTGGGRLSTAEVTGWTATAFSAGYAARPAVGRAVGRAPVVLPAAVAAGGVALSTCGAAFIALRSRATREAR
ncbi:hypothetical protein [Planobispora longispora]|uniref:Uncharacterized protein n=1 Tax=Planobispora longispora TaxID=28887 RepID=A0A8J3RMV8_9ACTN|nr:hypothetical protein [Planobispora longispora]GIH77001.1 hypothetical protein Plo01_34300 [Planobispora longispora]